VRLRLLDDSYAVCRLDPDAPVPAPPAGAELWSATRTPAELSLVLPERDVPPGARAEPGWRALEVEGPLDFALTGILARLTAPLAAARVSVFALATYDTDYVLVPATRLAAAIAALEGAGCVVA